MVDELSLIDPSKEEIQAVDQQPLASKFDVVRYLISCLQEKYKENRTVQKIVQDSLLKALNKEDGHTSQKPLISKATYYELYVYNNRQFLDGLVEINEENSPEWKASFDTTKGVHYDVEFAADYLKFSIFKGNTRFSNFISIGKEITDVTMFSEKLNDKGEVVEQNCDVNCYDQDGNQVPVPNRLDTIRCAKWGKQGKQSSEVYELLDWDFEQDDRYAFVGPISLNTFSREFEELILPAGRVLNPNHPDSRLLDNKCRFMDLCDRIEKQFGISKMDDIFEDKGTVLLSEALVEPISSHFGVIDNNPLQANGLAIIKKPDGKYVMLTIDVSKKDWTYDVLSMKKECSIEEVLHALNRNSRNKNLEGISDFINGRKLDCSLTLKLPPITGGPYHEPLLPPKPDNPSD